MNRVISIIVPIVSGIFMSGCVTVHHKVVVEDNTVTSGSLTVEADQSFGGGSGIWGLIVSGLKWIWGLFT